MPRPSSLNGADSRPVGSRVCVTSLAGPTFVAFAVGFPPVGFLFASRDDSIATGFLDKSRFVTITRSVCCEPSDHSTRTAKHLGKSIGARAYADRRKLWKEFQKPCPPR